MGSDESHFNVSVGSDGQSHSVHKPQPFSRERRTEAVSNRGPSAYQPNALPLGQTGSLGQNGMAGIFYMLLHGVEWPDTEIRVSTESSPWRRKFSRPSSRDSNPGPFDHESGAALPLSYPCSPTDTRKRRAAVGFRF